jgi:cytochrome c-type biogenesis protein CcmH/NrfF
VEILLWLVPSVVVTVLVSLWATWRGRERPEMTREEAARRMGEALARGQQRQVGRF